MEPKRHGYIYEPIVIDEHWLFGSATQAPGNILQTDRDWRPYLPEHQEVQNLNGIEPNACTIYGTLNSVQTLIKRKYGEDRDYSNRFLAVISGTDPAHGNNPHRVAEALRTQGDCDEDAWTFDSAIDTVAKFYAPVPNALRTLAKEFIAEWRLNHDWVPTTPQALWDALQYSPLGISVYAWVKDKDGLYYKPDPSVPDTHWCEIVWGVPGEYWLIRDSYMDDGELYKKVRWDTPFQQAKRYAIERQANVQSTGWQWFIAFLKSLWPFPVITPAPEVPVKPRETPPAAPESPTPPPTPAPAPLGDEKLIAALIQVESQGNDDAIGDKNLPDHAYGCLQIRHPVCIDVNRVYGTALQARQMLGNRALSIDTFRKYVSIYKCVTDEDKARVWNGGPSAKRKGTAMYAATTIYWSKVKKYL